MPNSASVLADINEYHSRCYDKTAESGRMSVYEQGAANYVTLFSENKHQGQFSSSAFSQFLTKLKVPIDFYKRCPLFLRTLIIPTFNKDKKFLMRYESRLNSSVANIDWCRAVLSDQYTTNYDDHLTFPPILNVVDNDETLSINKFNRYGEITRLELGIKDAATTYNNTYLSAHVLITNSETGHSSLWIEPAIRLHSSTGFLLGNRHLFFKANNLPRLIHRGVGVNHDRILELLKEAKEAAQIGIVQYIEASEVVVPVQRVEKLIQESNVIPNRFISILRRKWNKEEVTQQEAALEILRLAATLPILSIIQVEQHVGRWIGIFKDYKKRRESLQEEISTRGIETDG